MYKPSNVNKIYDQLLKEYSFSGWFKIIFRGLNKRITMRRKDCVIINSIIVVFYTGPNKGSVIVFVGFDLLQILRVIVYMTYVWYVFYILIIIILVVKVI